MISYNVIENTMKWLRKAFPLHISDSVLERVLRFEEESIELGQAEGVTKEQALALVEQVYSKPPGEVWQERGGVAITLAAYLGVVDSNLWDEWFAEFNRISVPAVMEKIREKHKLKIGTSVQ